MTTKTRDGLGIYVGRLNPIHAGHENIIQQMIGDRQDQCILVLGSINKGLSRKNMFSYQERVALIQKIFPTLLIQGIPDYPTDEERLFALDQIMRAKYTGDTKNIVFYGGCEEDIAFFVDRGRECKIINRFDGISSPTVSATEVRDHLLRGHILNQPEETKKTLIGKVNTHIHTDLIELFGEKLTMLKKI